MSTQTEGKLSVMEKAAYAVGGLPEVANSIIAAFLTMFFIPKDGNATMQLVYAFVTYNLYTTVMYTITGVAKSAQNAAANIGIISLYAIVPAALEIIIIFMLFTFYHYDEEAGKVLEELESRKQK